MNHYIPFTALSCAALLLSTGCQSLMDKEPEVMNASQVFDFNGIPAKEYFIGGGYWIRYTAKESGILYVADSSSKRLLATISMHVGESHEIKYDLNDANTIKNLESLGIDPAKASIKLYFVSGTTF